MSDTKVYQVAAKEKRLLVTFNEKDFRKLAEKIKDSGVIGVSQNLETDQIDIKLVAFLRRKNRGEIYGKFNRITDQT